jgi:hypothetical protein
MIVISPEGEKFYYPDTTDPQSFPKGTRIISGNNPNVEIPPEGYKSSQLEAVATGGLSGITGGPVTGRIFGAMMPKEMKLLEQSTKESEKSYPVTTGVTKLGAEAFASPEGIIGGKLLQGASKFIGSPIRKGIESKARQAAAAMIEKETGIIPRLEDITSIAKAVSEKALSKGSAWKATKPAVGAIAGGTVGSALGQHGMPGFGMFGGGHLGAYIGSRLMGAPPGRFFHGPYETLINMLKNPAVQYQTLTNAPQLGRFILPNISRPEYLEE